MSTRKNLIWIFILCLVFLAVGYRISMEPSQLAALGNILMIVGGLFGGIIFLLGLFTGFGRRGTA